MAEEDLLALLKRATELSMPDLRSYYRVTRKAKIVATYASDGRYYADVQPLRNDESPDESEPVIPQVEIPIIWGGSRRGIVCPPAIGTLCDLSYYDGDPNYPRISNFRWQGNQSPECGIDELIIQQQPGVSLKIEKDGSFITISPKDWTVRIDGNAKIEANGNVEVMASGDSLVKASGTLTLQAPEIVKRGNETCTGGDGGRGTTIENANRTTNGSITINGTLTINGNVSCSGNSYAASRSGGSPN